MIFFKKNMNRYSYSGNCQHMLHICYIFNFRPSVEYVYLCRIITADAFVMYVTNIDWKGKNFLVLKIR